MVDGLAAGRDVIAFDNTGIGATGGTTPDTVDQMADDAITFLDALGLQKVDLFGYSLGGFVAQAMALAHPTRVRKMVLASTGPKGAPGMKRWSDDVVASVVTPDAPAPIRSRGRSASDRRRRSCQAVPHASRVAVRGSSGLCDVAGRCGRACVQHPHVGFEGWPLGPEPIHRRVCRPPHFSLVAQ